MYNFFRQFNPFRKHSHSFKIRGVVVTKTPGGGLRFKAASGVRAEKIGNYLIAEGFIRNDNLTNSDSFVRI